MERASLDSLKAMGKAPQRIEPVEVPGVGTYLLRQLNCYERDSLDIGWLKFRERANGSLEDGHYYEVYIMSHCLCDENGERICTDDDVRDLAALPYPVAYPLICKALELNMLRAADVDAAKKDLSTAPSAASG